MLPKWMIGPVSGAISAVQLGNLKAQSRKNGYDKLEEKFANLNIDLFNQYTENGEATELLEIKLKNQQAFQVALVADAVRDYPEIYGGGVFRIVDIGDSAGSHVKKIRRLLADKGMEIETMSVNLDPVAVEKIKANGENAVLCRAEDYQADGRVNLYLSYEMIEHLHNPALFLHHLAQANNGDYMVMTVPYVAKSRVALQNSMNGTGDIHAEAEHIFELSPQDWRKIVIHSGWEVLEQKIYCQYPAGIPIYSRLCRYMWRKWDYEGFLGFVLKRNMTVADRYLDWED